MERYKDVQINIWLMKGVHHFIYCFDEAVLDTDLGTTTYWEEVYGFEGYLEMAILCGWDDTESPAFTPPIIDNYAPWIASMGKIVPEYDNAKYFFRAMTCD
jgi:hypothetical protein